jgi:hypothetical protein
MPNIYQWIVFICTVVALVFEATTFRFTSGRPELYRIDSLLLVAITAFVGFFLYRVAGKAKKKKSND